MSNLCAVCSTNGAKYKCPACSSPYCSVRCYRNHKIIHADNGPSTSGASVARDAGLPVESAGPLAASVTGEQGPTSHVTALEAQSSPFVALEQGPELGQLFARYPKLRDELRSIYAATLEPAARQELGFDTHRARPRDDEGYPPDTRGGTRAPWAPEKGIRSGLYRLRQRPQNDVDRLPEGLEEFRQLVLQRCTLQETAPGQSPMPETG